MVESGDAFHYCEFMYEGLTQNISEGIGMI